MQLIFTALSFASVVSYTVAIPMRSTVQRHLAFQLSLSSHKRHIINTRLFQSMGFANDVNNGESPTNYNNNGDDALKWEKLYNSGTTFTSASSSVMQTANTEVPSPISSEIRVITFDLDNTIWKTVTTISDANDSLSSYLFDKFGIQDRSEKIMGQLFKENPDRYAGVDHNIALANEDDNENNEDDDYANIVQNVGHTDFKAGSTNEEKDTNNADNDNGVHIQSKVTKKKPVYLTLLRKDAIRSLIQQTKESTDNIDVLDMEDQVDAAFEIWANARCESIANNFAPCAVEILTNLKDQLAESSSSSSSTSSLLQKVYIGAITDGNSNPNKVPQLDGVFDFVIRAEDVGVSKPDKRVYKAAVASLMLRLGQDGRSIEEFFLGGENIEGGVAKDTFIMPPSADEGRTTTTTPSWKDIDEDAVEAFSDAVGPWWVHVGDDFFKDIVAAKECQMRTVWTRELIGGSANDRSVKDDEESEKKQQRSVDDLVNDVSKSDGVLKMAIGASDFLTQSLQDEFCDAILDRFEDLSGLLTQWHNEGNGVKQEKSLDDVNLLEMKDLGASTLILSESEASTSNGDSSETANQKSHKFCIYCGEKLPLAATFCSSCGEKVA